MTETTDGCGNVIYIDNVNNIKYDKDMNVIKEIYTKKGGDLYINVPYEDKSIPKRPVMPLMSADLEKSVNAIGKIGWVQKLFHGIFGFKKQ